MNEEPGPLYTQQEPEAAVLGQFWHSPMDESLHIDPRDGLAVGAPPYPQIERWLSAERFAPYLASCNGDINRALSLYEWNISLGLVLMRDISHVEIALRNAYDRVMQESWNGDGHWLLDDASPARRPIMRTSKRGPLDANRINRKTIDAVVNKLPDHAPIGSLIANLTLGFWVHLSDRSREVVMWRTGLFRAWPKGTNRQKLHARLEGILRVRNRVAHAERLFNPGKPELSPLRADRDAVALLHDLCPEIAARLYGSERCGDGLKSPVETFCERFPAPAPVNL